MRRFSPIAASIVWLSLVVRLALDITTSVQGGTGILFGVIKFFTAFTHLTNIFIGLVLTASAANRNGPIFRALNSPWVTACAATYITVMALVWKLMLAPSFSVGIQMLAESVSLDRIVGAFLHGVNPALFLCFWFFVVPKRRLEWKYAMAWPIGGALYLVAILLRGAVSGTYPYPFVNASVLGYARVLTNGAFLLLVFVAFGLIFVGIDRWDPFGRDRKLSD